MSILFSYFPFLSKNFLTVPETNMKSEIALENRSPRSMRKNACGAAAEKWLEKRLEYRKREIEREWRKFEKENCKNVWNIEEWEKKEKWEPVS